MEDKDYIEAFNQGYELSKELGLRSEILKDISSGRHRIQAMSDGMKQYEKELQIDKSKAIIPPLDLDTLDTPPAINHEKDISEKDKDIEMDL